MYFSIPISEPSALLAKQSLNRLPLPFYQRLVSVSGKPPSSSSALDFLRCLVRLSRSQMTTISAVTYLAGALVPLAPISTPVFLLGYLFVVSTQLMVHFFGEYFDAPSDSLNTHCSPFTGGSRAYNPSLARSTLLTGAFFSAVSLSTLLLFIPSSVRLVGLLMLILANQYSCPPFKFNHRALGEILGSVVTNILLPIFSARLTDPEVPLSSLAFLSIPPYFIKVALFILLNAADRRPDWAAGKHTLPTVLGETAALNLRNLLIYAAYVFAILLAIRGPPYSPHPAALLLLLATAPIAFSLTNRLKAPRPYRLDQFLAPALLHSTFIVWSLIGWYLPLRIVREGLHFVFSAPMFFACVLAALTLSKIMRPRKSPAPSSGNNVGDGYVGHTGKGIFDIVVVGGGIGGLVAAATIQRLGLRCLVLEKREHDTKDTGADLALWPSARGVLSSLGVPKAFFVDKCFEVGQVEMCKEGDRTNVEPEVLKSIDMERVVKDKGGRFVLVPRKELMEAILAVMDDSLISYGSRVEEIEEQEHLDRVRVTYVINGEKREVTARVCIGADGARSKVRRQVVAPNKPAPHDITFCNELCYRGVLRSATTPKSTMGVFEHTFKDSTMRINYGAGLRSSFGFMSADQSVAYWWVKMPASHPPSSSTAKMTNCPWPEPLRTLHDETPAEEFYVHPIEEGENLSRWSALRTALIGDAAHVVTPNMGQGACMAIEDAFILCLLLKTYWRWDDGHLEAMYQYERIRKSFVGAVRQETRKQLFLGQLKHPVAVWLRELMLRQIPAHVLEKKLTSNCFPIESFLARFNNLRNEQSAAAVDRA